VELPLIAVLLAVGLFIGWGVGVQYARAKRGWTDYKAAKNAVPGARKTAWLLVRAITTKVGVIALLLVGAVAYAAVGPDDERAEPAPSPSPSSSATHGAPKGR
jgi:amino acid transporter